MGAWRELAYIARRIRRIPGLALAIVASIGLGIAANATIFSMVSKFVLSPPPVGEPSTLMSLYTQQDGDRCCNHFSWPLYRDVRDQAKSFSGVAGYYELLPASIGGTGEPERVWGQAATANFFDVAQLRMAHGRGFLAAEEDLQVIVLGHNLWQRRFASDPAILGKTISLSGRPYTVIGVAPAGFHGLDSILNPEFWVPLGNAESLVPNIPKREARDYHWISAIGRLQPGVTRTQAAAELDALAKRLAIAYPASDKGNHFLMDLAGSLPPSAQQSIVKLFLGALTVVALLVLCIACANVANLLLAQASSRQKEMAVRLALGASRGQLVRQMLAESTLLALAGGMLGFALSVWATSALSAFHVPAPVPLDVSLTQDWRVSLYTFVLSLGAGLLFGLAPAWAVSRPLLTNALKGEDALARPGRRWSLRSLLVIAQVAMSLVLLCATGLFLRSLQRAANIDIGFRSGGMLTMSVDPAVHGYTAERTVQFLSQLRQRAAALPGVTSAVITDIVPLSGGHRSDGFHIVGGPKSTLPDTLADLYMASPGYFETMGIPLLAGRDFANESATGTKVAIVNRAFAEQVFGTQNPIGQLINGGGVTYQVIGVAGNIKSRTIGEDTRATLFRSIDQSVAGDPSVMGYTLIVSTRGDAAALTPSVRDAIRALDPTIAVFNIATMQEHVRDALFFPRLAGTLFGVFGGIGLMLATVGLYGVVSYSVSRRTREIGIRMALGAQVGAVQRLIVGQGMLLTLIALALGLPGAWMASKLASSFLYGVQPHDLATFIVVPFLLAGIALLACWIPARRAAMVDPQTVLRYE
jgi:predicted permease